MRRKSLTSNHSVSKHSTVEKIITEYATARPPAGSNHELEIRFKNVSKGMFEALCGLAAQYSPTLETSANLVYIISNTTIHTQYVKKFVYTRGKISDLSTYTKEKIMPGAHVSASENALAYSVELSRETPAKLTPTGSYFIRMKLRLSSIIPGTNWRLDLTAVAQLPQDTGCDELAAVKQALMNDISADDFLAKLNHKYITKYECELEWVNKKGHHPVMRDLAIVDMISTKLAHVGGGSSLLQWLFDRASSVIFGRDRPGLGLKQLTNQVISLNKMSYMEIFPPTGMLATIKADGLRALAFIGDDSIVVASSTEVYMWQGGKRIAAEKALDKSVSHHTICDAEYIDSPSRDNSGRPILRIFDIIVCDDKSVVHENMLHRTSLIPRCVEAAQAAQNNALTVLAAQYTVLSPTEHEFKSIYFGKYPYSVDGIIISEPDADYNDTRHYKWKPPSHNTIDFYVTKDNTKGNTRNDTTNTTTTNYILNVGSNGTGVCTHPGHGYVAIPFTPSADPTAYMYQSEDPGLEGKIIELGKNIIDDDHATSRHKTAPWVFHKVRTDRWGGDGYYGNDFRIAETIYMNFIDPFELEDLWSLSMGYFAERAPLAYHAASAYKRFVIGMLFKSNFGRNPKWMIDLACGRGADLYRYSDIGAKNVLFVDKDKAAIVELVRRKLTPRHNNRRAPTKLPCVHTLVANLITPSSALLADMLQYGATQEGVDGCVCNFALHYLCGRIEDLRNVLQLVSKLLRVGGLFLFTAMDGAYVDSLLKDYEEGQTLTMGTKYSVRKDYSSAAPNDVGQMIAVSLPFAAELVPEPLCRIEVVLREAKMYGLEVELNNNMADRLSRYDKAQHLDADDINHIKMYKYVTLRKVK